MVKKETMLSTIGAMGLLLGVIAIIAYKIYFARLNDFFYAAIGLLTFTALFYAFTISAGAKLLEESKDIYIKKKEIIIKQKLSPQALHKEENLAQYLKDIAKEIEYIEDAIGYINLNFWIFISTLGYLSSIIGYILRSDTASAMTFIQTTGFWVGFYSTLLIVTTWFVVNKNSADSKKHLESTKDLPSS